MGEGTRQLDPHLARLVKRSKRPGAVRLWNLLNRGEREAAARWFIAQEADGRTQLDQLVATAMRFRPQTVRRWPADRIVQKMGVVSLHDPSLAQLLLVHRADSAEHLPMVRAFLDGLGIPHEDGDVKTIKALDTSAYLLGKVGDGVADEYGDRAVAIYLLSLWSCGAPLGEKSCAWLKQRWGLVDPAHPPSADGAKPDTTPDAPVTSADPDTPMRPAAVMPERPAQVVDEAANESASPAETVVVALREKPPAAPRPNNGVGPAAPEAMLTTLDRILKRAVEDCVRGTRGALNEDEVDDAIDEFVKLNGTRHESYFHAGYRDVLLARAVGESMDIRHPAHLRWYWAGAVSAWAMRERWDRIVREYDGNTVVRQLASGDRAASAAALLPMVEALRRVGRGAELGRALTDTALVREPALFEPLLTTATELLHKGDAVHSRHIFELLIRVSEKLEDRGTAPKQRHLLDARRRFAHSLRTLHEHERAKRLLEDLLVEDPDPDTHAMVHADLGLMAGGFDSLEDVVLPGDRAAVHGVRDRLVNGEDHFRQSVKEGTEYSAHGHYCLGVLALARGVDEELAERHLAAAHMHFAGSERSYGKLVARSDLYAAIAKARQLRPAKLAHAAQVIRDALESGAHLPTYLANDTIEALEEADDKACVRQVTEAIIAQRDDVVLDKLADCAAALRHCPLLAERLHERARASGRPAEGRAADLRAALQGHMHAQSYERAGEALDALEDLARGGVSAPQFQEILADPARYDPAWSLEDATFARARCHEARGGYPEATRVLRQLFHSKASEDTEHGLDDAKGILGRVSGYGIDRSYYEEMRNRYGALVRQADGQEAAEVAPPIGDKAGARLVRVLVVGGAEQQARIEGPVRNTLKDSDPRIRTTFIQTGWGSSWNRALPEFERHVDSHDALVILRFVRTNLGRHLRQRWPSDRPWRLCWSGGRGAIVEMVQRVAALARNG